MEQETKKCPYCGEEILAVAKKCKHYGEWLESKEETEQVAETIEPKPNEPEMAEPLANQHAIEKNGSEITPVETYYESSTKKIIGGFITAVLIIVTIWFLISPPEIEFSYLFGTLPYGMVFLLLSIVALYCFAPFFDEQRKSKVYLDSNGDLDIETPREYEPLSVSPISKVIGRANIYGQKNLSLFKYHNGRVLIRNSKDHEIEGALSDLTYTYKMDKDKGTDEWYIYQFIITDTNGNEVQFNRHNTLFTDEEYADIEMLLSLAGTVKEAKISKFTRKADAILSKISDLDFSDLASSAIIQVGSIATSKITDKAGLFAKKRIYDSLSDKKKSMFTKIKNYGFIIILVLVALLLLYVNVQNAIYAYHEEEEQMEYNFEQDSDSFNKDTETLDDMELVDDADDLDSDDDSPNEVAEEWLDRLASLLQGAENFAEEAEDDIRAGRLLNDTYYGASDAIEELEKLKYCMNPYQQQRYEQLKKHYNIIFEDY